MKNARFQENYFLKQQKMLHTLLIFIVQSGAKVCASCRSRKNAEKMPAAQRGFNAGDPCSSDFLHIVFLSFHFFQVT